MAASIVIPASAGMTRPCPCAVSGMATFDAMQRTFEGGAVANPHPTLSRERLSPEI
jgi:hypothetical protein